MKRILIVLGVIVLLAGCSVNRPQLSIEDPGFVQKSNLIKLDANVNSSTFVITYSDSTATEVDYSRGFQSKSEGGVLSFLSGGNVTQKKAKRSFSLIDPALNKEVKAKIVIGSAEVLEFITLESADPVMKLYRKGKKKPIGEMVATDNSYEWQLQVPYGTFLIKDATSEMKGMLTGGNSVRRQLIITDSNGMISKVVSGGQYGSNVPYDIYIPAEYSEIEKNQLLGCMFYYHFVKRVELAAEEVD